MPGEGWLISKSPSLEAPNLRNLEAPERKGNFGHNLSGFGQKVVKGLRD